MPEIATTCAFSVDSDNVFVQKNQNGYILTLSEVTLTQEQAASLAWLVNTDTINFTITGNE